jgi:hypothetical protein
VFAMMLMAGVTLVNHLFQKMTRIAPNEVVLVL